MIVSEQQVISKTVDKIKVLRENLPKIDEFFNRLEKFNLSWALVGGFVRDSYLGKVPNDIDIVADSSDRELLTLFSNRSQFKRTAFGGFRFSVQGVMFDLWSVKDSWTVKSGLIKYDGLESFLQGVSYNIDTPMVDIVSHTYYDNGFKDALETQTLDLIIEKHPYPKWIALKAKKLMFKYKLKPTDKVLNFAYKQGVKLISN